MLPTSTPPPPPTSASLLDFLDFLTEEDSHVTEEAYFFLITNSSMDIILCMENGLSHRSPPQSTTFFIEERLVDVALTALPNQKNVGGIKINIKNKIQDKQDTYLRITAISELFFENLNASKLGNSSSKITTSKKTFIPFSNRSKTDFVEGQFHTSIKSNYIRISMLLINY